MPGQLPNLSDRHAHFACKRAINQSKQVGVHSKVCTDVIDRSSWSRDFVLIRLIACQFSEPNHNKANVYLTSMKFITRPWQLNITWGCVEMSDKGAFQNSPNTHVNIGFYLSDPPQGNNALFMCWHEFLEVAFLIGFSIFFRGPHAGEWDQLEPPPPGWATEKFERKCARLLPVTVVLKNFAWKSVVIYVSQLPG